VKRTKAEVNTLLTAWIYFARVPLPKRLADGIDFSQQSLEKSARYLSLVGVMVGLVAGLSFWAGWYLFGSKEVAVLLSMLSSILATGAFHEDGIADFFDAFGGGWWSKERILEIMKDSRIGTFGGVALIMALLLKFAGVSQVGNGRMIAVLVAGHALSRLVAGTFLYTHQYVRENDKSYFKPMIKDKLSMRSYAVLCLFGLAPMVLLVMASWYYLLLVPAAALAGWLFGRYFVSKIGGYTGDCLGAAQQIVEVCFYLAFLLVSKHLVS
jgi:adenosylcobinamide-GDP ribazoletransferase